MSEIDFEFVNFENELPSDISDSDAFSELLRFSHERIAEVKKQRDHLAALLRRAKIYVHECPFKREIIDALQAIPPSQGGGK